MVSAQPVGWGALEHSEGVISLALVGAGVFPQRRRHLNRSDG